MFRRLSLQHKQTLIIMLTSSASLLLACAAFVAYEVKVFRSTMLENLASLAGIVADASTAALDFNDAEAARQFLGYLGREAHVTRACLYNADGLPFAKYARDPQAQNFRPPPPRDDGRQIDRDRLAVFRSITLKGERLGTVYIECDLQILWLRLQQYVTIVAFVLLASLLLALFLSMRLQRLLSKPILRLAALAKQISTDRNYSVRATRSSEDELGQLIEGFNEMLAQIQARDADLRSAQEELERRVQERTRELQQEIFERRRAEEGLQQQLSRISLLNSITRAIADRQDLESVVQVVLRELGERLPIDYGRVYLYDPQTQSISVAGRRPIGTGHSETSIFVANVPLDRTGLQACREGQMVLIPNTLAGDSPLHRRLAEANLRAAVAVPLLLDQDLFGILVVARREVNAFRQGECEFLRTLGEHVALAAHQARLHAQLQQAYDELRQTQMAVMQEERLRALGQMASGIAHDINNALCPIVVYADLLLENAGLDEHLTKHLQHIKTAGEDIAHIVSRMREFYRPRDEKDQLTAVDLNKLADQVVELTRPRWRDIPQARGVTVDLHQDLAPQLPEVLGNQSELREALINLILNAVDAMPQGGRLTLRTRARSSTRPEGSDSPSHIIVEVDDTGTGMDEETRKRCLEPFFSTKGKRGTGLGLAMVYGVMQRHGGSIEIQSAPGQGATVRLVLPVREIRPAPAAQPGQPLPALPSLRVLCIDDEPLLRELMKQLLEYGGHSVEVADGGQAGLHLFRTARQRGEPFDVVITDLGMPHLDGRQLAKTLKNESAATPIIMLTGWGTIMREDGDMPAQVDGLLSKPPRIQELYQMLGQVCSTSAGRPPSAN